MNLDGAVPEGSIGEPIMKQLFFVMIFPYCVGAVIALSSLLCLLVGLGSLYPVKSIMAGIGYTALAAWIFTIFSSFAPWMFTLRFEIVALALAAQYVARHYGATMMFVVVLPLSAMMVRQYSRKGVSDIQRRAEAIIESLKTEITAINESIRPEVFGGSRLEALSRQLAEYERQMPFTPICLPVVATFGKASRMAARLAGVRAEVTESRESINSRITSLSHPLEKLSECERLVRTMPVYLSAATFGEASRVATQLAAALADAAESRDLVIERMTSLAHLLDTKAAVEWDDDTVIGPRRVRIEVHTTGLHEVVDGNFVKAASKLVYHPTTGHLHDQFGIFAKISSSLAEHSPAVMLPSFVRAFSTPGGLDSWTKLPISGCSPLHDVLESACLPVPNPAPAMPHDPALWAVSGAQLATLREQIARSFPGEGVSMTDVVARFVKPVTKAWGTSYAVMINHPSLIVADAFVSHCWFEEFDKFVESLAKGARISQTMEGEPSTWTHGDPCPDTASAAEAAANVAVANQIAAGATIDEASNCAFDTLGLDLQNLAKNSATVEKLRMVAKALAASGADRSGEAAAELTNYARIFELQHETNLVPFTKTNFWICSLGIEQNGSIEDQLGKDIRESPFARVLSNPSVACCFAVQNDRLDMYTRVWCVYECYLSAEVLKKKVVPIAHSDTGGSVDIREAEASKPGDKKKIMAAIAGHEEHVNMAVQIIKEGSVLHNDEAPPECVIS